MHEYGSRFQLLRWRTPGGRKRLVWERLDDAGAWIPGLGGLPTSALPLYREPDTMFAAAAGDPLFVVESESSVDALNRAGHYATTWPGGASSPPLERLTAALAGVPDVRIVADHDDAGLRCARRVLVAVPHATGWLSPGPGDDVRDLLEHDPRLRTLRRLPPEGVRS